MNFTLRPPYSRESTLVPIEMGAEGTPGPVYVFGYKISDLEPSSS